MNKQYFIERGFVLDITNVEYFHYSWDYTFFVIMEGEIYQL